MKAAAVFAAIVAANAIAMMLILSAAPSKVAQNKARERRLAEGKMNARLLRLNL